MLTLIQRLTSPTSDQFNFTGLSGLSSYQRLVLMLDGVTLGTDGAFLNLQFSISSSIVTTGYRHGAFHDSSSGSSNNSVNDTPASGSSIRIYGGTSSTWGVGNAAGENANVTLFIGNATAALYKIVETNGGGVAPSGSFVRIFGGGILENTGTIDGIRILTSSGTMTAGTAALYGIPTS
jgi:hypothetical protein